MSSTTTKNIAILLSTGKQGRNIVNVLVNLKSSDKFHVIALTRNENSEKARKLLNYQSIESPNSVQVVTCDIHDKTDMIRVFTKYNVWGVYCTTANLFEQPHQEFSDAKNCIDAAIESKVKFFIYSSILDCDKSPEYIPHLNDKYLSDQYLKVNGKSFRDGFVSLKLPTFMDNLLEILAPSNGYFSMPIIDGNKKCIMIACQNIADIAAAFFNGDIEIDTNTHSYDCIGDIITPNEICNILSNVSGNIVNYSNKGPLMLFIMEKFGVNFAKHIMAMFRWKNEREIDIISMTKKKNKCNNDFANKMIDFGEFAEMHFKDKNLGESMTRKTVKYGSIIALLAAGATILKTKYSKL